jgi:hypothetical protein
MSDKERKEIQHLQDALIDLVMEASDEEILAELAEDGLDLDQEAEAVGVELARAAGKARMAAAKSRLERQALRGKTKFTPAANDDVVDARRLTMAARNGSEQSEADVQSAADDLREIARYQDQEEADR